MTRQKYSVPTKLRLQQDWPQALDMCGLKSTISSMTVTGPKMGIFGFAGVEQRPAPIVTLLCGGGLSGGNLPGFGPAAAPKLGFAAKYFRRLLFVLILLTRDVIIPRLQRPIAAFSIDRALDLCGLAQDLDGKVRDFSKICSRFGLGVAA
jgi:hypothetical protein